MCVIAAYTGEKRAAPLLIDMIQKTEHTDGGFSTGIVTIHEGKLYMRKVLGDVEVLLRETDALSLPGTTGIIHSRTDNSHIEHAHPFLSGDGELALVTNGTNLGCCNAEFYKEQNRRMDELFDKGVPVRTAVFKLDDVPAKGFLKNGYGYLDAEPYALMIGDKVKDSPNETIREDLVWATKAILEQFPRDVITVSVHQRVPDTITVGTVSRSLAIAMGEGEAYMCTSPFGIPEEVANNGSLFFVQPTSVLQVSPRGIELRSTSLKGTRVEQLDFRTQKEIRLNMEKYLKVGEENAISIYGLPFFTEWNEFWREPMVDSKYVLENSRLKPIAPAIYEGLWSFYKEGRLKYKIGTKINSKGKPRKQVQFWLDH